MRPLRAAVPAAALVALALVAAATVAIAAARRPAGGDWPTYHHDNARTGTVGAGPRLGRAHELWSAAVDGSVYAEPLVAGGKVIVATESDSVYAFDARSGQLAWRHSLGAPVAGRDLPCGDIDPSGITSTPVVDVRGATVYTVAFVRGFRHTLAALDLRNGAIRWQRGVDPPGADPRVHQQRGALTLSRGRVYIPYGGLDGDCGDYHGWVVGAPAGGPRGAAVSFRVPTHREGGIWAPSGAAADRSGNVYVATGNGDSSSFDFGNSVIRLSPRLRRTGFFAPANAPALNGTDTDLGSTAPLLVPRRRVFVVGKDGIGYVLRARHLGRIGHPLASRQVCRGAFGGFALARGVVYVPCRDGVFAVRLAGLRTIWRGPGSASSPIVAGPGVWLLAGGSLLQLDRRDGRVRFSAAIGGTATFATPAAAGDRVFAVGGGRVHAFG